jgi:hypothetical protein
MEGGVGEVPVTTEAIVVGGVVSGVAVAVAVAVAGVVIVVLMLNIMRAMPFIVAP